MSKFSIHSESVTEIPFNADELARTGIITVSEGVVEISTPNARIPLRFWFRRTHNRDRQARTLHLMSGPRTSDHPGEYRKARAWADANLPSRAAAEAK